MSQDMELYQSGQKLFCPSVNARILLFCRTLSGTVWSGTKNNNDNNNYYYYDLSSSSWSNNNNKSTSRHRVQFASLNYGSNRI